MKLWNYIVIFTGVAIIMALAGLPVAGFTGLFNQIGLNISITETGVISEEGIMGFAVDSAFWDYFFKSGTGILVTLIGTGFVGVGLYLYTKDKKIALLPVLITVFLLWVSVFVSIINYT